MHEYSDIYASNRLAYLVPGQDRTSTEQKSNRIPLMMLGVAASACLGFSVPGWPFYFALICMLIVYLGVIDTVSAACLFLLLNPLTLWIRNADPTSVVLAGATSVWLTLLLIGWLFALAQNKYPLKLVDFDILLILMYVCWSLIGCARASDMWQVFLGVRFWVFPCLFYVMMRSVVMGDPRAIVKLPVAICISAGLVATIQQLWYFGYAEMGRLVGFDASFGRLGGARDLFGVTIDRIRSIIGGGPSNVAIFLMAGTCFGVMLLLSKSHTSFLRSSSRKAFYLFLVILTGSTCVMAISRSAILVLTTVLIIKAVDRDTPKTLRLGIASSAVALITMFFFLNVMSRENIIEYTAVNAHIWLENIPTGISMVIGNGFFERGGMLVLDRTRLVDAGWISVWNQVGIIGLLPWLIWMFYFAFKCYTITRMDKTIRFGKDVASASTMMAAVTIGLLIGSVHTAIIARGSSNMVFLALAATCLSFVSLANSDNKRQMEQTLCTHP